MAAGTLDMLILFIKKNLWAIFFAIGVVAPVFWMVIDRDPPFEITNGHIEPEHPVKNGYIEVTWDIKPLRTCSPSDRRMTVRSVTDQKGVVHTYTPVQGQYGTPQQINEDEIQRRVPLPMNIVGVAKYNATACYHCNPIQIIWPICITTPTLEFIIADTDK